MAHPSSNGSAAPNAIWARPVNVGQYCVIKKRAVAVTPILMQLFHFSSMWVPPFLLMFWDSITGLWTGFNLIVGYWTFCWFLTFAGGAL